MSNRFVHAYRNGIAACTFRRNPALFDCKRLYEPTFSLYGLSNNTVVTAAYSSLGFKAVYKSGFASRCFCPFPIIKRHIITSMAGNSLALLLLQSLLNSKYNADVLLVLHDDPHGTEVPHPAFDALQFISNFSGSAGLALVTQSEAFLWADGRYHIQAEKELSKEWTLMKYGLKDVPDLTEFLQQRTELKRIAIDASSTGYGYYLDLAKDLKDREFIELAANPVFELWTDRPYLPLDPVRIHPLKYAGTPVSEKVTKVRESLKEKKIGALLLTELHEVAYLFNLRGQDCELSPLFYSYAYVDHEQVVLFIHAKKVPDAVEAYLKSFGVVIKDYNEVKEHLKGLRACNDASPFLLWVAPDAAVDVCLAFLNGGENREVFRELTPISRQLMIKNESELAGMREASIVDSIALCRFFGEMEKRREDGTLFNENELSLSELVTQYRSEETGYVSVSFIPISSIGSNGAVVHYRPTDKDHLPISPEMYLLDSGGQYESGTTDVTRTVHFGNPTHEEKEIYTLVLKGHLALRNAVFPEGIVGQSIDVLARQHLWNVGRDYMHGTGHGIGAHLNVHEGPLSLTCLRETKMRRKLNLIKLEPGMVLSNEPGYYKAGKYGVRIENGVVVTNAKVKGDDGVNYYTFEDLTLVPHCKDLIVKEMLTTKELKWLNDYHALVAATLLPRIDAYNSKYQEAINYIKRAAEPL